MLGVQKLCEQQLPTYGNHFQNANAAQNRPFFAPERPLAPLPTSLDRFSTKSAPKHRISAHQEIFHSSFFYTIFSKALFLFLNFFFPFLLFFFLSLFLSKFFLKQSKNLKIEEKVQISQKSSYLLKTSMARINFIQRPISTLKFEEKTRPRPKK